MFQDDISLVCHKPMSINGQPALIKGKQYKGRWASEATGSSVNPVIVLESEIAEHHAMNYIKVLEYFS